MRDWDGQVSFAPRLPRGIERLAFQVGLRGRRLRVEVTPDTASYALREDDAKLEISHWGERIELGAGRLRHAIGPAGAAAAGAVPAAEGARRSAGELDARR